MVLRNVGQGGKKTTYEEIVIAVAIQFYEILLAKREEIQFQLSVVKFP
jgi:hypothetical protein